MSSVSIPNPSGSGPACPSSRASSPSLAGATIERPAWTSTLAGLERQQDRAGIIGRRRLRQPISEARQSLKQAQDRHDTAVEAAEPYRQAVDTASVDRDALVAARRLEELRQSSVERAQSRPGPELGIGL